MTAPPPTPGYGDEVRVRYTGTGPAYVAGLWFDAGPEDRTVPYTRRLEEALDAGPLTLISE